MISLIHTPTEGERTYDFMIIILQMHMKLLMKVYYASMFIYIHLYNVISSDMTCSIWSIWRYSFACKSSIKPISIVLGRNVSIRRKKIRTNGRNKYDSKRFLKNTDHGLKFDIKVHKNIFFIVIGMLELSSKLTQLFV